MLNQKLMGAAAGAAPTYIEDVFSTFLYAGNSSTQTITNGIDLAGEGGLVWLKNRSSTATHLLLNTVTNSYMSSDGTFAANSSAGVISTSGTGFSVLAAGNSLNASGQTYTSWTFRKQPKFFDVVTYTGTGANRTISHALGSVPACIIVKRTDTTGAWQVYHRSLANTEYLILNTTAAKATGETRWNSTTPTSSVFSLGTDATVNASGGTYVAYLFAHDAGGFGLTGTDNVISCGSYTGNGSATGPVVTLGYEPQWLMIKNASGTGNWQMIDNMRGMPVGSADATLQANLTNAESSVDYVSPTATGFQVTSTSTEVNTSASTYIYIAIRRGPMKVPTDGTSVLGLNARTGTGTDATITGGTGVSDAVLIKNRGAAVADMIASRLTGKPYMVTSTLAGEGTAFPSAPSSFNPWDVMDGVKVVGTSTINNASANTYINYLFDRAPSVFDVVCYTGTGAIRTITHNLAVAPQLMIVKTRSASGSWVVYSETVGPTKLLLLNTNAAPTTSANMWNDTQPTSSVFTLGGNPTVNTSGNTYVAYLFASCPGVSKVGSYTGTGTTQVIDCGFTAGSRFVMIKRTDSTGDWYVWDSTRGIVAGNDPHLSLNSTAAEVTTNDSVDPVASGFAVNQVAATNINVSGASYIYLAIA